MFLAYNNGITVTASSVELSGDSTSNDNEVRISKINDLQIVNGGQTTVSLFTAKHDKTQESDFSKIFVQMKLTVVKEESDFDEIVPNISKYSNTQNKVQASDFASNDPYHREMETLSRSIWTPSINGKKPIQWFFERARGQYSSALNAEPTPSKRKEFKEHHPLLTKTDLAKVILSWEEKPNIVALGSQKAFNKFMTETKEGTKIIPDKEYYEHTIAKTILFKEIERIVVQQHFGGYKANIVAYTYYKLMLVTERRINIEKIWDEQTISEALKSQIITISKEVQKYIVGSAENGANVSEFCKSKKCVEGVKALEIPLDDALKTELVGSEQIDTFSANDYLEKELTPEEKEIIDKAWTISSKEWQAMANWAKDNNLFDIEKRSILFKMATLKKRNKARPSLNDAKKALATHDQCIEKGFIL